ncbi:murein transglycosylase [Dankookia rubra]|uniref:Murein transglycosylase n=1 Tax=Dankookia rubra TaxID=1442381 RepID=A0A4R5QM55_9PROT|nr:lytic transglycosylase domain-containing protein [Dankookia rubra]TDH64233.1 murein transglycosylase [Dankookia rubra]
MRATTCCLLLLLLPAPAPAQTAEPGQLCRSATIQAERERGLPPRLLAAIGKVESGRRDPQTGTTHPWPWAINAEGRGSFFPDKSAAIAAVRALQAEGVRSIDVGCLQVNLRHHPQAFASLEEAFDPLANARYAARFLAELQASRGDWLQAAGAYHSQTPGLAEPYRARVAAAWLAEQGMPAPPVAVLAAASPGGAPMLDNGAARMRLAPATLGAGRGLDAYRAAPIPLAGRPSPASAQSLLARRS